MQGATEIVALNVADPRLLDVETHGFGVFLAKLASTIEQREMALELALAEARGVPVRHILLQADTPVLTWDFSRPAELIACGYEITRREIAAWQSRRRPRWSKWLARLIGRA